MAFQAPQGRWEKWAILGHKALLVSTAPEFLVWLDLLGLKVHQGQQASMVPLEIEECGALLALLVTSR